MAKKKEEIKEEAVETSEESIAAASLHPAARSVSDPKALDASKVSMMKTMLHMASGMGKEDMTHWFNQAMALIGHEADKVGDHAAKNSSSIDTTLGAGPKTKDAMPKLASITPGQSMKEDVAELFAGEELSEEFKDKAAAIFEAAVVSQILVAREELIEEFETKLTEEVARVEAETSENLDRYLDYVVEEWMKENEVAIESSLRTELTNDFITGLKNLFAEHYIDLPEDKIDVVEQMADKVDELEKKLDEAISENAKLQEELVSSQLSDVVEELANGLAMTQQEKFRSLAEELDFDGDVETFKKKLEVVKETYFKDEKPAKSNIEEETFEGENTLTEQAPAVDPRVAGYVKAISRTVK
jgi:hypothetical protein